MVSLASGSEIKWRLNEMGKLYAPVRSILGPSGTILPIGDPGFGKPDAATFTTYGNQQHTFTWDDPWRENDGHLAATSDTFPYRFQGIIPFVNFNGVDEAAAADSSTYWERGDDTNDFSFSAAMWINVDTFQAFRIFSHNGEWWVSRDVNTLQLRLIDQTAGSIFADRSTNTDISAGTWNHIVFTYDGRGSTDAADGINCYTNGVLDNGSASTNASYGSMQGAGDGMGFAHQTSSNFYAGSIAGGALGFVFTHKELSADEVKQLYNLGRAALWL